MPAGLPVCLPAYLPACLPVCLPACLPACLPSFFSFSPRTRGVTTIFTFTIPVVIVVFDGEQCCRRAFRAHMSCHCGCERGNADGAFSGSGGEGRLPRGRVCSRAVRRADVYGCGFATLRTAHFQIVVECKMRDRDAQALPTWCACGVLDGVGFWGSCVTGWSGVSWSYPSLLRKLELGEVAVWIFAAAGAGG